MKYDRFQLALREWRDTFSKPMALIIQLCIGIVLGISGPFGTIETVSSLPRITYWVWVVFSTYGIGVAVFIFVKSLAGHRGIAVRVIFFGLLNSAVICAYVLPLNVLLFGRETLSDGPLAMVSSVFLVAFFVSAAVRVVGEYSSGVAAAEGATNEAASKKDYLPIMQRVPIEKRGELVALSVEDHYVRVKTLKGEEFVLMRLSDAILETTGARGEQVHRSHWVNYDQVVSVRREGDRAFLTMSDQSEIPVSRANIPKLKEAGLLPR